MGTGVRGRLLRGGGAGARDISPYSHHHHNNVVGVLAVPRAAVRVERQLVIAFLELQFLHNAAVGVHAGLIGPGCGLPVIVKEDQSKSRGGPKCSGAPSFGARRLRGRPQQVMVSMHIVFDLFFCGRGCDRNYRWGSSACCALW